MKCVIILTVLFYASCYADLLFSDWENKQGIKFSNEKERKHREKIFLDKKKEIDRHNSNLERTYEKALNQYSYLSGDEFISLKCGTKLPQRLLGSSSLSSTSNQIQLQSQKKPSIGATAVYPFGSYKSTNAPSSVNYTNLMQSVQNQLDCNACWAFSTMGQIEGMLKIRNSAYNTVLGPQFLLDCNTAQVGCTGGWPTDAMTWLQSTTGGNNTAPTMNSYLYKDIVGTCKKNLSTVSLGIKQVKEYYFGGDEGSMKAQIANYGPTVVAVYATSSMQSYNKGVFYDPTCPTGTDCTLLNHAVVVVGYGTDSNYGDYWLVKNSWGTTWGESGYMRMARNKENSCNIACYAMFSY